MCGVTVAATGHPQVTPVASCTVPAPPALLYSTVLGAAGGAGRGSESGPAAGSREAPPAGPGYQDTSTRGHGAAPAGSGGRGVVEELL